MLALESVIRKYFWLGSIAFLTGSMAKAKYDYKEEDLFKPAWRPPPGPPLRLTDFKHIEIITTGPWSLIVLAKCTFKNGEVAIARMWYSVFEVICTFIAIEAISPPAEPPVTFPNSYVSLFSLLMINWCILLLLLISLKT